VLISSGTYLYMSDLFRPLPYNFGEILQAWEEDRMKPFELVRNLVEELGEEVRSVRLYGAYFDPKTMTAVIEYMVDFRRGTYGVKIVHAENPRKAIMEYYRVEREGKLVS